MLLGLLIPTAGTIRILGHDMARDRFSALTRMNFSSPYVALPQQLSVAENLRVYCHLYNVRRAEARIGELAEELDLHELLDRPAGQLFSACPPRPRPPNPAALRGPSSSSASRS